MKKTTELHKAAERLDVALCNTLIDAHPKSVLTLNDEGYTVLHTLLKKIFSVHPKNYSEKDINSFASLVRKMMNAAEGMSEYVQSLVTLCYFEEVHFSGCYPTERHVTAVTLPQILCAFDPLTSPKNQEVPLEDFVRYQMGDADLADEIMLDRLLIEAYQKSYINK